MSTNAPRSVMIRAAVVLATGILAGPTAVPTHWGAVSAESTMLPPAFGVKADRPPDIRVPISFEQNVGQFDGSVHYLARTSRYSLRLGSSGATVVMLPAEAAAATSDAPGRRAAGTPAPYPATVRMQFAGARRNAAAVGERERPGKAHYFLGDDRSKWRANVPTFGAARYQDVYPGIDVVFYGKEGEVEYDFILAPHANPQDIRVQFSGASAIRIDSQGDLVLRTPAGTLRQRRPNLYQERGSRRESVDGRYVRRGKNTFGIEVGAYDRARTLIIDPVIAFSTYLGGNSTEYSYTVAVGPDEKVFVAGWTRSTDFPVAGTPIDTTFRGVDDSFVTKLDPETGEVIYSTYIGGSGSDGILALAIDATGRAYMAGGTASNNYPTSADRIQAYRGGIDAFASRLSADGSVLEYSTYLGGSATEEAIAIAIDGVGDIYVTGYTHSLNFPSINAFRSKTADGGSADAYVVKFTPGQPTFTYATCFGGNRYDISFGIKVDVAGYAHVVGSSDSTNLPMVTPNQSHGGGKDAFALKLDPSGSTVAYSTYLGGLGLEEGRDIALDADGNVYLTGETSSANFPVVANYSGHRGGADAFLTKLDVNGAIVYSTYLGGHAADHGWGVLIDDARQPHVIGYTASGDFPGRRPVQAYAGQFDTFVTKFDDTASELVFSTHLGGTSADYGRRGALTPLGAVYVSGETMSANFPTVNAVHGDRAGADVFVTRIDPVHVASMAPVFGLPAGGTEVRISGGGFEPGATVLFGDVAATNVAVQDDLTIRATSPAASSLGAVDILVRNPDGSGSVRRGAFTYTDEISTNQPPEALNGVLTGAEDRAIQSNLSSTDPDADPVTYAIVTNPSRGTVVINSATTGSYTYTPSPNFNGTDSFSFRASDTSSSSAPATISVTVTPVNDAPRALNASGVVSAGGTISGGLPGSDVDRDPLTYQLVTSPVNGTATLNSSTGFISYTPNAGFIGTEAFTYNVSDGRLTSNTATITVRVQ